MLYTPTQDELDFANSMARKEQHRFCLLLLLKAFQRLGYFPEVENIPLTIVQHVRIASGICNEVSPVYSDLKTQYRHHQAIRQQLGVSAWSDDGLRLVSEAMTKAAGVMNNPADLINVAIEELVRQRIELPAFSTLDRHSRRIRTLVNSRIFETVLKRLSELERKQLDTLLEISPNLQKKSLFFAIKQLPKRSTLAHLQDLLDHIIKLSETVDSDQYLLDIPYAKSSILRQKPKRWMPQS